MLERYKLRLRDGTVLVVDHDALSSWLVDGRAMVQPVGSERWVALKTFLAKERVEARNAAFRRRTAEPDAPVASPPLTPPPLTPPPPRALPLTPPPPKALPLIPPPPRNEPRKVRPVRVPPLPAKSEPASIPVPTDEAPAPPFEPASLLPTPEEEVPVPVPVAEELEAPAPPPPDPEPPIAEPEPVLSVSEAPSLDVPTEEPAAAYTEEPVAAYAEEPAAAYAQLPPTADEHVSITMPVAEEPEAPPPDSEPIEVWEPSEEAAALSADSFPDSFRRTPPAPEVPAAPITLLEEEDVTPWRTTPPMRGAPVEPPPSLNPQNLQVLAEEPAAPLGRGRQARAESAEDPPIIPLKRFADEDEASFRATLQPEVYETHDQAPPDEETPFLESSFLGLSPTWDARLKGWFERLSRVLGFLGRWVERRTPRDRPSVAPRRAALGSAAASAIARAASQTRAFVTDLRGALAGWTAGGRAWVARSLRRDSRGGESSSGAVGAGVGAPPRPSLTPPPNISDLPVLRLKPDDSGKVRADHDVYGESRSFDVAWRWTKRAAMIAALLAGGIVAAGTWETWAPAAARFGRAIMLEIDKRTRPSASSGGGERPAGADALPAAAEQLPHLDTRTIALVMSSNRNAALDPPEVFALAYDATERGLGALTTAETQELGALRRAVLAALSTADRQRLREYDLLRSRRSPLPAENREVLRSFARGARALPSWARLRLQELLGKAIAAALGAPAGETPRAATAR
jgi:hypothetical protein